MPCLEISMPKVSDYTKSKLAHALTEAFCTSTGHEAEIFGIRFFEYEAEQTASGGKMIMHSEKNQYIHFLLYCPRLKRTSKQKLATEMTRAFVETVGHPSWQPTVHISEHPYDNVIVNGKLLSDSYKECAEKPFYYDMPKD